MERPPFESGSFYHIYNRGTEKRKIFLDDKDRVRFLHHLYVCNDSLSIDKVDATLLQSEIGGETSDFSATRKRDRLVDVACYALMPNHFHLLLRQRVVGGISKFLQKILTGYTMYFNRRRTRTGALFQGVFKSREIDSEEYLARIVGYIHANPAALAPTNVKEHQSSVRKFLSEYRWSSHLDHLGVRNFPSIITPRALGNLLRNADDYENCLDEALDALEGKSLEAFEEMAHLLIDADDYE